MLSSRVASPTVPPGTRTHILLVLFMLFTVVLWPNAALLSTKAEAAGANPTSSSISSSTGDRDALTVISHILEAQADLVSFEAPATARIYINGHVVLTADLTLITKRPNYVAVKWLGMTIRPRRGVIFIDPQKFASGDYVVTTLARPDASQPVHPSKQQPVVAQLSGSWVISAESLAQGPSSLRWTLYIDPATWLITQAHVVTGEGDTATIEARYEQTGPRRWEPVFIRAEGAMVLREFLPDMLIGVILGRGANRGSAVVELEFRGRTTGKA